MSTQVEVLSLQLDAQQMAQQAQQAQSVLQGYATGARSAVQATDALTASSRTAMQGFNSLRGSLDALGRMGTNVRDMRDFSVALADAGRAAGDFGRYFGLGSGLGIGIESAAAALALFSSNTERATKNAREFNSALAGIADATAKFGTGGAATESRLSAVDAAVQSLDAEKLRRALNFTPARLSFGADRTADPTETYAFRGDVRRAIPGIGDYLAPDGFGLSGVRPRTDGTDGTVAGDLVSRTELERALRQFQSDQRGRINRQGQFGAADQPPSPFSVPGRIDETLNPNFIGPQRPEFSTPAAREAREAEYRAQQKALQDAERETQRLQDQQQRELRRQAAETQREYEQLGQGMASAIVGAFDQMASGAENWRTAAVGAIRQIANEIAQLTIVKPLGGALAGLFGGGVGLGGGALSGGAAAGASAGAMAGARAGFGGVNFNTEGA